MKTCTLLLLLTILLFAIPASAQIQIVSPIPNGSFQSIQITVTDGTVSCEFTVYSAPSMSRICSLNGHQITNDALEYDHYSSYMLYNFFGAANLIYFHTDKDVTGRYTWMVITTQGSAGPNQFPGQ